MLSIDTVIEDCSFFFLLPVMLPKELRKGERNCLQSMDALNCQAEYWTQEPLNRDVLP